MIKTESHRRDIALGSLLAALIFSADLLAAPGTALPVLYGAVVALCARLPWDAAISAGAVVTSALTVLACLLDSSRSCAGLALVDRGLGLAVIWGSALLLWQFHNLRTDRDLAHAVAKQATLSKQRFLAAASHDLRHPVQAGMLFHDLLRRRLTDTPHQKLIDHLGESLVMMRKGLDTLSEVSRLDTGRVQPQTGTVSVAHLFDLLHAQFDSQATATGLKLIVVSSRALVRSDPDLLFRILQNLLANAFRYTPRGRVLLGCRRAGKNLRLQIWDTGIGIPSDSLGVIFEEFHQLRSLPGDAGGGLGLGLAVVDRLVRLLGHQIRVRSIPERGSVFEVIVPISA